MLIEPILNDELKKLAAKRRMSTSAFLRVLAIDELRQQGLLPDEFAAKLFRGTSELV